MRKLSSGKNQVFFFVFILMIASMACHMPGTDWWVDVNNRGDVVVDPDADSPDNNENIQNEDVNSGDEGNHEMEGVDEETSTNIPAGTYIGWMVVDLSMTKCEFVDLGTTVTVEVGDDGTVTGEMTNKFTLTCVEREGCIPIGETTYISTINGQITDTNNAVEIHETHSFRNIVRCNPPEDYTEENTFVAEIRVSGDKMTCTIPGDGNRIYFTAKKQ